MAQAKKSSGSAAPYTESGQHTGEDTTQSATSDTAHRGDMPTSQRAMEELEEVGAEVAPQLGTVAAVAVATALIEAELLPAVLIGAGAAMLPRLLPGAGYVLRPVLKTVIRAGYGIFSTAQQWVAEAGEQVQDMVAEVQAEQRATSRGTSSDLGEHGHSSTANPTAATGNPGGV
jgi:hypothetical protein